MKEFVIFVIPTPLAIYFIIFFQCNFFNNERKQFLPTIKSSRNTNTFTFRFIICETKLFKLCRFLKIVL